MAVTRSHTKKRRMQLLGINTSKNNGVKTIRANKTSAKKTRSKKTAKRSSCKGLSEKSCSNKTHRRRCKYAKGKKRGFCRKRCL